jgi:hypothetical protein
MYQMYFLGDNYNFNYCIVHQVSLPDSFTYN